MAATDVALRDIYLAQQRISPLARRSPLVRSALLSDHVGASVYLKLEGVQDTGSFKVRGAASKLLSLSPSQRDRGVIAFSTGNHGRAVSYVAQRLDIHAVICVSEHVPQYRVDALERHQAEVVVHGKDQDEAMEHALGLQEKRQLTMVHPFDDPAVIAGQGTIGLELMEDLPEIDTVLVPISGGGLISGIALVLKSADSSIRVIGVSMDRAPVMYHSLRAGKPVEMEEEDTIADALLGGIGLNNQYTFRMIQEYVDDVILVTDEEIAAGMAFALANERLVVEGAGAVGIAALLHQRASDIGHNAVAVVSGSNVEFSLLLRVAQSHIDAVTG